MKLPIHLRLAIPTRLAKLLSLAALALLLSACASAPLIPEDAMPCFRAGDPQNETSICALDNEGLGVFLIIYQRGETHIRKAPGLYALSRAEANPTGSYMYLITIGEGHPWLNVIDIAKIASEGVKGHPESIAGIDPYPGWISAKWQGRTLMVSSNVNLTIEGQKRDESENDGMLYSFRLDIKSNALVPLGAEPEAI